LVDGFPDVARQEIERWWVSLTEERREQVAHLCDERQDKCVFGIVGIDEVEVESGHFMPDEEIQDDGDAWNQDRFDYLLNHPELVIAWEPSSGRVHHVCSAHAAALRCLVEGAVPKDLQCPFSAVELVEGTGATTCLMDPFRGRKIRFVPFSKAAGE